MISEENNMKPETLTLVVAMIVVLALWDGVWKLIALWKSARNNQLAWPSLIQSAFCQFSTSSFFQKWVPPAMGAKT